MHGPQVQAGDGTWQRIPVAYLGLTSHTTMRSLNAMLCRFYGLPERGNADLLAHRAAECVVNCKTRLVIVDDVHFLDISRRDGREVANHFKWLANVFPVTFLFVGVGLRARGLLDEGLAGADAAFSQTARRWNVLTIDPFEIRTQAGQRTWRQLLLGIERDLVLAGAWRGMIARRPGRVPVRPLHRALRLADVADQPRLLPGGQDRGRVADRRPAGRGADRPGRRGRPRPAPGRHSRPGSRRRPGTGPARPPPGRRRRYDRTRLPFTLTPLDGEPFGLWLHAYAARLAMSPGHLAEALGMPGCQDHEAGAAAAGRPLRSWPPSARPPAWPRRRSPPCSPPGRPRRGR